ncbi:nucleoside hydrolase-like domain-containing protein [Flavobacterium ajazii]|uniref:nucleoside hydrolase-like domain-containing protein n=1 Tax=Flavobacterium ajazii TaxID=2692318 RepID=UPI0013D23EA5|nr:nucleoside hydrolase-like domain-containing protein [Flavobacterium ajazii]
MNKLILTILFCIVSKTVIAQQPVPVKPRILVSTDIGGTDPDDNQSMIHLLMYNEKFTIEGLVSSPSFGEGNKEEILRTIDLYEKDLPKLKTHVQGLASPKYLRSITKQGRKGAAPLEGFTTPTEGSDWIIKCALKKSKEPLWILVWGGLEDLAQALHDKPEIQKNIKVFWIGGPNKKWSANSYAYIAMNFPALWFIESNSSYYGFFSDNVAENLNGKNYYKNYINEAGFLGKDYKENRYKGRLKMGDTPSLLYMMDGDPNNPKKESWGGSYIKFQQTPRIVFKRNTSAQDTVPIFSIVEFHFKGPVVNIPKDSACITMTVQAEIGEQKWDGFYTGDGNYIVRYSPKRPEKLTYKVTSDIPGFETQTGTFLVSNLWPGKSNVTDYSLGKNWYTDRPNPELYDGIWQGGKTVLKWRSDVLLDWAKRWEWLR